MTAILLVILLWQQGQAQKPVDPYAALKTPSITIVGDGDCMGDAMPARCYNPEVIVRIDWPKEHEREQRVQQAEPSQAAPFDVPPVEWLPPYEPGRLCSEFLMHGVWHCLAVGQKP